jgi:uncharacterized protein (DUF362 family)
MGAVLDEFTRSMASWGRIYAGRPDQELRHLLLLALEREEIVAIGYREALIARRLGAMPIGDDVRALIRQALIWTWQDEEMHAVYIRGALLKAGRRMLSVRAMVSQAAGALGGWTGSVRQHLPWARAPIARTVAAMVTYAGMLAGKVPREVRDHVRYGTFQDFCLFNVDAELTAALCFARLSELAKADPRLPANMAADFLRVQRDEERHARLFEVLAAGFDRDDRMATGMTVDGLAQRIGAFDANFLPRSFRRGDAGAALGSMAPVYVITGEPDQEGPAVLADLLEQMDTVGALEQRAAVLGKPLDELTVAIKPSFMYAYHRRDPSPVTDPGLVRALVSWLRKAGCGDVAIIEAPSVYAHFFARRSVAEVADYVGIGSADARVVDASSDQVAHHHGRGMAQYTISRTWRDADLRISFGKLRSHPIDEAILSLSNLEWLGASYDDLLFAERQAHRHTATMMQVVEFPPHLALIDAYAHVPDGVVGMMGSRHARALRRIYAGIDALAVDAVAARHLGLRDPRQALFIRTAGNWLGVKAMEPRVLGCDQPIPRWRGPRHSGTSAILSMLAFPLYVFASGRGAVFVPAMDEQAFPPVGRVGWCLRLARWVVRRILGLQTGWPPGRDGSA